MGRAAHGEPVAGEARAGLETQPAGYWPRATAMLVLAASLAALKRPSEAAGILRPALRVLTRRFGDGDARVREASSLLATLGV